MRRFASDSAGATAVEFALVAGPLLLLVFGAIEASRLMWTREALQSTAIAGARCMGIRETSCAPGGNYNAASTKTFIAGWASSLYVSLPAANITLATPATCSGATGFSRVTITYTFDSIVAPILNAMGLVTMTATSCFPNQA